MGRSPGFGAWSFAAMFLSLMWARVPSASSAHCKVHSAWPAGASAEVCVTSPRVTLEQEGGGMRSTPSPGLQGPAEWVLPTLQFPLLTSPTLRRVQGLHGTCFLVHVLPRVMWLAPSPPSGFCPLAPPGSS